MTIGGAEPLTRPVARNLTILLSGRTIAVGLQFTAFLLLAAYLGPEQLGAYLFGTAFATLFRLIPSFAFEPVITREIAQHPEREPELVPNLLALRFVLGVCAYLALAATALLAGYRGENLTAALVAGTVVCLTFTETLRNPLGVRLRFGWTTLADVLEAAAALSGIVVLVLADASLVTFLWLYVGAKTLNATIVFLVGLRSASFRWTLRVALWWPMVRTTAPLALAGLLTAAYFRVDMALLARLKPEADVGQYGAAYKFIETFLLVPMLVMGVLQPVLARSFVEAKGVLQRRYARAVHLMTLLAMPMAVLGTMTAWRVVPLLPGLGGFEGAGVALSILAPGTAFIFVAMIVQSVLISGHLQRQLLVIAAFSLTLSVVLYAVLIPLFSYVGAAIATSITELGVLALSLRETRSRLALSWPGRRLVPTALAGILLVGVLIPGYLLHPLLQLGLGLLAFPAAAVATRAVNADDLHGLFPEAGLRRLLPAALRFSGARPK
jgi:O-antigen/teichoic acid export membrane protein